MFPLLGSLFTGSMGLLGSMFSSDATAKNNEANIAMQQQTNQMQIQENQKNRDFQEQMSNTAYQRASSDMTKAGLNPALMFGSGSAASSPSGGTPNLQAPRGESTGRPFEQLGNIAKDAVSSAVQVKTMDKMADEMSNLEVENNRLRKVTENVAASTATEQQRAKLVGAQTANVEQDTTQRRLDRARQEWEAIKYLDLSNVPDAARKAANIGAWGAGKFSDVVSPFISSAAKVRALLPQTSSGQRSRVDSSGKSFDEFWENRTGFGG